LNVLEITADVLIGSLAMAKIGILRNVFSASPRNQSSQQFFLMKKYIPRAYLEEGLKLFSEKVFDTITHLQTYQSQRRDVSDEERKQLDKDVDSLAYTTLLKTNDLPNEIAGKFIIDEKGPINQEEVMTRAEFREWFGGLVSRAHARAKEEAGNWPLDAQKEQ
jgi:hypothetical protein